MVGVVVGQQDQIESAAIGHDGGLDGFGVGRVDDGDCAAGFVVQQPGVVVGKDRDSSCDDAHPADVALRRSAVNRALCYNSVMATDAQAAAEFYATARGTVAARLLRDRLGLLWPADDMRDRALLGLGFTAPYMRLWLEAAARCVVLTPAQLGATRWPMQAANLSCTAEEDALPFPDLSFDRVVVVHGLEAAENARRLLREIWRVLKDDGRLLVVAPNRRGMWAHTESTPFGQGEPYSPGQIARLLAASLFRVQRRDTALYMPPSTWRLMLRGAQLWENGGRLLAPRIAGLTISEAVKDVYAAVPARAAPRRRMVLVDAA